MVELGMVSHCFTYTNEKSLEFAKTMVSKRNQVIIPKWPYFDFNYFNSARTIFLCILRHFVSFSELTPEDLGVEEPFIVHILTTVVPKP